MAKTKDIKEALTEDTGPSISEHLSTGCTLIDLNIGGGQGLGYKQGVFHRISGVKGAGKTFLLSEIGALAKRKHGDKADIAIQDCEARNTMDTEELYGVPREELISDEPPTTVEELDAHLGLWLKRLKPGKKGVYGVDSLESLTNAAVEERTEERQKKLDEGKDVVDKGTMGMQTAKFFSQEFFRTKKNAMAEKGATCFLLSQMRENVDKKNPYSPKYKTTGGPSIEHWVDSASELKVVRQLGDKARPIGAVVELKTTKLTAPRPFRSCRYIVYYSYGIDNIGSNIDYLFDLRTDNGELSKTKADLIAWDGKPINAPLLKKWVQEFDMDNDTNLEKEAKAAFKAEGGRSVLSVDFHSDWFRKYPHEDVVKSFCERFGDGNGKTYSRDELIDAVEADPAMEEELEERVIDKWEAIERQAVASISGRKRRF
jgi:polyhydroxyalkanoate synthesis regulator phasin